MLVGIALGAVSFACFHNTPEIGGIIGTTTGAAFILMALVVKRSDVSVILRSYLFTGIGVVVALTLGVSPLSHGSGGLTCALIGAVIGWFLGTLVNQSGRTKRPDDRNSIDPDDTQYHI